jgi:putative flippase GtrA
MPTTGRPVRGSTGATVSPGAVGAARPRRPVPSSGVTDLWTHVRNTWRILLKEIVAFGAVGAIGLVIQLVLFNVLHDIGALKANAVAMVVATVFTYVGNRYLSFSHRARTGLGREATWFFAINAVTFVIAELILGIVYLFDKQHDKFITNLFNLLGIGTGTVIRFWAYKRFVFLHPDRVKVASGQIDADDAEVVDHPAA